MIFQLLMKYYYLDLLKYNDLNHLYYLIINNIFNLIKFLYNTPTNYQQTFHQFHLLYKNPPHQLINNLMN
jgi:hypothetical protein